MKKILIATRDLNVGGVQKSLVELLKNIEGEINVGEYVVDLLLLNDNGALRDQISNKINIIKPNKCFRKFGVSSAEAKKEKKLFLTRTISALWSKIFSNKLPLKIALKKQCEIGEYDLAISYAVTIDKHSMYAGWAELVLNKCSAGKKVVYVHNDYVNSALNNKNTYGLLKRFDNVWFVSKSCEKNFLDNYSEFNGKTNFLYNFVNGGLVKNWAEEKSDYVKGEGLNIVTVSRLSPEKGHLRILNVLKTLKDDGYKFKWHIVGDGPIKNDIENRVIEWGLQDFVYLYGEKKNPYPYIKNADLFLLGSYNESFGLVLIESMILQVPVFSTNTIAAMEIVGENGFVCENNEKSIYNELKNILNNPQCLLRYKQNLKTYKYENEKIKEKFKRLINE